MDIWFQEDQLRFFAKEVLMECVIMSFLVVETKLNCIVAESYFGSHKHIQGDQFCELKHCIDCPDSQVSC